MPASQSRKSPKTAPRLQMLPIAKLLPTSDNRRRPISKASVESLARSMKKDGVLQPIVVRPHPTRRGRWEIRAGERRWHAARLAGFTEIPAIVRTLDDQSALSVTIAENLQRENLHPLEEAATIQLAFDRGYDIKSVAASLGKSEQYVAKRASLSRLSKSWKAEILRPDSQAGRLTVPHLELIARLPTETQDHLAENDFQTVLGRGFPTVAELRRLLDGGLQSLRAMPWPLDDDTLDPKAGSCLNCPKRSCRQPLLFDGEEAGDNGKPSKTDRCLDPACFARKQTAWVLRCETTLRQQHPDLRLIQVSYGRLTEMAEKAFGDRLTHVYQPRIVKPSDKRATPVMQVDGPKAGALVHVDLGDKSADRNGKAQRPKNADGTPKPLTLAERRARLQKRRDAFLVNKVEETLRAMKPADVVTLIANFAKRTDAAASASTRSRWCWPSAPANATTATTTMGRGNGTRNSSRARRTCRPPSHCRRSHRSGRGGSAAVTVTPSSSRRPTRSASAHCSGSIRPRSRPRRSRVSRSPPRGRTCATPSRRPHRGGSPRRKEVERRLAVEQVRRRAGCLT